MEEYYEQLYNSNEELEMELQIQCEENEKLKAIINKLRKELSKYKKNSRGTLKCKK